MSIIYTVIARGVSDILVECNTAAGNFPQITVSILKKLKPNSKLSYTYNANYFFHYINENNITFLCMTEASFSKRVAFVYLADIQERFLKKYSLETINTVLNFGLNSSFSDILKSRMNYYNTDPEADKLNKLKGTLNEVKDIMVENIDKILEREQKVEILVKKTTTMNQLSSTIKKQAVQTRRDAYWRSIRVKVFISAFVVVVIYIVIAMFCGGLNLPDCT